MNKNLIGLIIPLLLFLTSCEKTSSGNINVETYVKLLKSGKYNLTDEYGLPALPAFLPRDIPELLKYADEEQIITKYPHNPVSSIYYPDPRLGILIIWTIESVRVTERDSKYGKYPSLGPSLMIKNSGIPVDLNIAHPIVSGAYKDWWNSNSNFDLIRDIDPLKDTIYDWR